MSHWLAGDEAGGAACAAPVPGTDRALRFIDVALAVLLLVPLALPLLALRRHAVAVPVRGQHGRLLARRRLQLPGSSCGRVLRALGAADWPLVWQVLRGEMAWVGPRPRALDEPAAPASTAVRPGLVNPWFIRRRTAVHYGDEALVDAQYLARRGVRHDLGLLLRGLLVCLLPPVPAAPPGQVHIGDVRFDNLDVSEALGRLQCMLDGDVPQQVGFVNPACVNIAARHRGYRRALARAALVLPDGIGIRIGSQLLGTPLKQNVNGTDLFPRLCEMLCRRGAGVFLLGGNPGVAEAVGAEIRRRWPGLRVAGCRDGYFTPAEEADVVAAVRASGADVLLVARGVPTQDVFIDRHLPLLGVRVAMGVGGLFDFVCGRVPRAPLWMRETGLEWVWRLRQEPGRMWRRYLVGNFSFLGRVLLQRLGWRRPAQDGVPAAEADELAAVRAVVFATDVAGDSLPLPAGTPLALLPLGHQTVAEHLMEQLARAGIVAVDVVASSCPGALRQLLGEGERWGLRMRWRLAKDPVRPYGALQAAARATSQRLVLLHADRVTTLSALERLVAGDQLQLRTGDEGAAWIGRASVPPLRLRALPGELDRPALGEALRGLAPECLLDASDGGAALERAENVLRSQHAWLCGPGLGAVPASWIRTPWGAMSPLATVEPGAVIAGPVLVGPGCWIERGAEVGPHVVLSRDVVLLAGTTVRHTLLLPKTYVGAGLEMVRTIACGTRVRHLSLDVETSLPASDALVLSLAARARQAPGLAGRAAAAIALLLAGPALALHVAARRVTGLGPAWCRRSVVVGREAPDREPRVARLRCARSDAAGADRWWAGLAGLLDVAAGRRCWVGARPRTVGQWYALRPEWQEVLARSAVGVIHAPSLGDARDPGGEAEAVADVFAASVSGVTVWRLWLAKAARRHRGDGGEPRPRGVGPAGRGTDGGAPARHVPPGTPGDRRTAPRGAGRGPAATRRRCAASLRGRVGRVEAARR